MLDFLIVVVLVVVGLVLILGFISFSLITPTPAEIEDKQRKRERLQTIADARHAWIAELNRRYEFCTRGTLIDGVIEWPCILSYDGQSGTIGVFGYSNRGEFSVKVEAHIPVADVLSVEVVRPIVTKRVQRTQAVAVTSTKKKSAVARGIVGGVALGPVGLVLGAASGLSKDVKSEIKEHKVWENVQAEGDPQLHIGTSDPAHPLIRMKLEDSNKVDVWQHRIKAIQAATLGSPTTTFE